MQMIVVVGWEEAEGGGQSVQGLWNTGSCQQCVCVEHFNVDCSITVSNLIPSVRVVNKKEQERRAPKARESRRRGRWGLGRGIPSPVGEGAVPLPRKFLDFLSSNGAFWCILGACFRRVKQSRKAVLCSNCQLISYLTWRMYHPWYHTHNHISESAVSQSDTHAAYTMDIVDTHVHATVYLYILLSCILFQEIQLHFTKVTFCWWHVYFMNTLVAYGP